MQSDTQPLRVPPESLERKHEVGEKSVRNVLFVGGGAAALLVFSLLTCVLIFHFFSEKRPMQSMTPLGIILAPNLAPLERFPQPNLQIDDDRAQMTMLYTAQSAKLDTYGWVDRSNGIVRIPIKRAMDLIIQRGLPVQTNAAPAEDSSLRLTQKGEER
jgi:hypothetical protein